MINKLDNLQELNKFFKTLTNMTQVKEKRKSEWTHKK